MDDPQAILREVFPYLGRWNVRAAAVELASHSENIVFKVTDHDGNRFALRVHRPAYHTLAELNSEQMWTDALLRYGLRVPSAYPTLDGEYYVAARCGGTTRYLGLIAWLDGRPLAVGGGVYGCEEIAPDMVRAAGAICAQFHNQASTWQPPSGFTRHHLNVQGLMGERPFWGRFWDVPALAGTQRRTVEKLRQRIAQRLLEYGESVRTYSMIHTDMHVENLFVSEEGLMVIDFDDSGYGWHQYDLAVILFAHSERADFPGLRQALIEGYRTQRDLSEADLSLLDMFILIRTLALIGWANERPELGRGDYIPYLIDKACRASTVSF